MSDSIMYQEDAYVVLESDREEQFMTAEELKAKLKDYFNSSEIAIPRELTKFDSLDIQIQHLIDNYFELDLGKNKYLQWYVVRLEK
ncbi:chlororespiratory reduction protein 7 [Myxosarcina sp. GI1]|uniref:chlororespiratory reduction protein 7 n=1 Tax=Myxosarcina sp. GI1 TaxID=1541065 RepID=UPI000562D7A9|nr:chlororespiratory reduction protein 7 [Myxosarcina sp. GI1]